MNQAFDALQPAYAQGRAIRSGRQAIRPLQCRPRQGHSDWQLN